MRMRRKRSVVRDSAPFFFLYKWTGRKKKALGSEAK